ncbi:NAD(P)-dependent alcohol dehydrogenase [Streptomyces sp. NPDC050145]|uniref:NAD(P)-dependent alcohol dehydrogenase n=1 Tax=Streptomyces sp. NPDC050145 TaxID=3365602 RepID=UPI00378FAC13
MRTRAAVLRSTSAPFTVEDVDLTEPGPGEVLVRVTAAGMCHTDLGGRRPRPAGAELLPAILGHEGAGVVESTGPGVTRVRAGDHVVLSFDSCGWCRQCLAGTPSYCDEFRERNLTGRRVDGSTGAIATDGTELTSRWFAQSSFAHHCVATERSVVKVDPELPLDVLAPLGCGVQTGAGSILIGLGVTAGDSVAVFGAGAVGLSAVMAARLTGASRIVAVDLHAKRRELSLELGATHALDGSDPDLVAQLRSITGGGLDHAFDTTGVPSVMRTAVEALAPRGALGLAAGAGVVFELPPPMLAGRTITFLLEGNAVPQTFIPQLIEHWQRGRFPFERMIRHYTFDAINDAERDSTSGETIKPVLVI